MYNIDLIRSQFPVLLRTIEKKPLIYLDNAATSQTPVKVLESILNTYEHHKANVHRGVHTMSQESTAEMEHTRRVVADYINASSDSEIIFTRGTTEAINLVASSYGQLIPEGSEIILTVMEHHANIVPWQLLAQRRNLTLRPVKIHEDGSLDMEDYRNAFNERTALAAFCHVSNVLGTVNPVKKMVDIARKQGVTTLVDGAQASPHLKIDVEDLECDFYTFSAHKMYGPTGVGVLYGRKELLEKMPPYQGGGEMIKHVSFKGTTFADLPFKFEAGTPDFVGIAAFSKAIEFIKEFGLENIEEHTNRLLHLTTERLTNEIEGIRIFGTTPNKAPVISFLYRDVHPYDVGMLLDKLGIAVRTGHHCAQPLMEFYGIPGTVRAAFAAYNTLEECDIFIDSLKRVVKFF